LPCQYSISQLIGKLIKKFVTNQSPARPLPIISL
jgi:hypothetical protein